MHGKSLPGSFSSTFPLQQCPAGLSRAAALAPGAWKERPRAIIPGVLGKGPELRGFLLADPIHMHFPGEGNKGHVVH